MRILTCLALATTLLGTTIGGPTAAQTADGPECGPFSVRYEAQSRNYVDLGEEGPSVGDQSIVLGHLFDTDGNQIGVIDIFSVVLSVPESGGEPVMAHYHHSFPNGTLASQAVTRVLNIDDESTGVPGNYERAITGGTGAFANAIGTVTSTRTAEGVRELVFDITCDR